MQFLNAKLRALVALCLVALVGVAGCKPSQPTVSQEAIAAAIEVAKSEQPDARVHVLSHKFGATGDNPAGWKIDPTTGNLVAPSGKVLEGLSYKNSVAATAVINQAPLTGLAQTIDTIALSADAMRVNLWNQTTTAEKGCWVVHSGAWTRCPDFAAGSGAFGSYFPSGGSANKGVYLVTAPASGGDVVGTANLTAVNLSSGGGAVSSVNGQTGAVVLTSNDVTAFPAISVAAVTAAALPAYTYANGSSGVGATITANANGAFPTVDGVTLTVGTDSDRFLLQNPAAAADAGLYRLTTQGSGGSAWVATRDTRLDTAAEFNARPLVVASYLGTVHGGGTYTWKGRDTITMGTTALYARRINMATARESEGFSYREDFSFAVSPGANLNFPVSGLALQSATITVTAATLEPNNTATEVGLLGIQLTASSATNFGGAVESSSATGALGRSYVLGTGTSFHPHWRGINPTLSTGAAEYAVNMGYVNTSAASQVNPANSILFIYDRPTNVNWKACCIVATVATCTDTGIPAATTPYHDFEIDHNAGGTNVYFDIDGAQVASIAYSACPSAATNMFLMADVFGSVGASTRSGLTLDVMENYVHWPAGRF